METPTSSPAPGEKCPTCGRRFAAKKPKPTGPYEAPAEIKDLDLFTHDRDLCEKWWELRNAWEKAYPKLHVLAEINKAHAWLKSNPARRKKNHARFLMGWLSRSQKGTQPKAPDPEEEKRAGLIRQCLKFLGYEVPGNEGAFICEGGVYQPESAIGGAIHGVVPWAILSTEKLEKLLDRLKTADRWVEWHE